MKLWRSFLSVEFNIVIFTIYLNWHFSYKHSRVHGETYLGDIKQLGILKWIKQDESVDIVIVLSTWDRIMKCTFDLFACVLELMHSQAWADFFLKNSLSIGHFCLFSSLYIPAKNFLNKIIDTLSIVQGVLKTMDNPLSINRLRQDYPNIKCLP